MEIDFFNYHTWFLHEWWFFITLIMSAPIIIGMIFIIFSNISWLTGILKTIATFLVKGTAILILFLVYNYWASNVDKIFGLEKFSALEYAEPKNDRVKSCLEAGAQKRLDEKDYDFVFKKIHLKRCKIYAINIEKELDMLEKRQLEKMKKDGIQLSE